MICELFGLKMLHITGTIMFTQMKKKPVTIFFVVLDFIVSMITGTCLKDCILNLYYL